MSNNSKLWAIVPAAGVGRRVGGDIPKQYLDLHGRPLIAWTLKRLLELDELQQVTIAISAEDNYWSDLDIQNDQRIQATLGGKERCDSVLNGLESLKDQAADTDWVLVHDAARPCVRISDIRRLISVAQEENNGAILAVPVRDTMKKSNDTMR